MTIYPAQNMFHFVILLSGTEVEYLLVTWERNSNITDHYRFVSRAMLNATSERTLAGAIIPKSVGHLHTSFSLAFRLIESFAGLFVASYLYTMRFRMKAMRVPFANTAVFSRLPMLDRFRPYARASLELLPSIALQITFQNCGTRLGVTAFVGNVGVKQTRDYQSDSSARSTQIGRARSSCV